MYLLISNMYNLLDCVGTAGCVGCADTIWVTQINNIKETNFGYDIGNPDQQITFIDQIWRFCQHYTQFYRNRNA